MKPRFPLALLLGAAILLPVPAALAEEREILYYRNPMNPEITSSKPAKDWMGMDYIPVYADEVNSEDGVVVRIDPALVQNLGVRTEAATRGRLWRRIDATGVIGYDEGRINHIHMRSEGWIEDLRVHFVGERFAAGDVLFEIYAPTLVNAQEEFLQALRTGQAALIATSRERLRLLGVDEVQVRELEQNRRVRSRVIVRAPRDGVVTELNARHGMFVTPAMEVMSLADLSSLWLLVEVPERQSSWVAVGQVVELRLPALPGEVFEGRIEYLYPGLDARTRTLRARVQLDNPGERFRPDMFANVRIFSGSRDDVLSIPRAALIRTGRAERVIVAEGEGRFRAVEVSSGMESGDWVEIRDGLEEGDRVVVSGQFLLDSEASIQASAMRLRGAQAEAEAGTDAGRVGQTVEGMGTVTAIKAAEQVLTLDHEAIEALGWPAMVMDIEVHESVDLGSLELGDRLHFILEQGEGGGYRITSIHVME